MKICNPDAVKQARSLRAEMTVAERALWKYLRRNQMNGLRFRRQADVGRYIIDFLCHEPPLAVEINGPHHEMQDRMERDARKDAFLRSRGFKVLRIKEKRARDHPALVAKEIAAAATQPPTPAPPPQAGEGI